MAKKNMENYDTRIEFEAEGKSPGFFKKTLYLFLIPVLFIIAILLIGAQLTNTNIFEIAENTAGKLPFVDKKDKVVENSALNEEQIVTLQAEIQQKEVEINQLQSQIDSASTEKDTLLTEQERLLFEIEKLKREQVETQKDFSEILSTFEKMSAKTAAPILIQMSDTEALRILSSMKPDTLSAIFTKMSPVDAARYTELLAQQ